MMIRKTGFLALVATVAITQAAAAAVTQDEARQLGSEKLTLIGSEKGGNKEGTIPPYSGKAPKAPGNYDRNDPGQRPDPYNDKALYTITAQNAGQHADKLDGMVDVFKKYPNFRMDVYPTHRDVEYPKYLLENTVKNATSCKAVQNELKLEGCFGGIPFPIPKTGNQVMWNHLLQFAMHTTVGIQDSIVVPPDGRGALQGRSKAIQQYDYYDPKNSQPNRSDLLYWKAFQDTTAPPRQAGNLLILLDNLDMVDKGRRAYQYVPGQRRVKLAPNLAYDTPSPQSGGASTMDDAKGFLGALDRFDFKLVGKKEKFIVYDNFAVTNHKICTTEKMANHPNFPHPDCVRWELHRVWVVEGTLKPGYRHIYQKRIFYWDEDAPGAGTAENYDAAGKLYRVTNLLSYPFYDQEFGAHGDANFNLDLQTGVWFLQAAHNAPGLGYWMTTPRDDRFFSPESLVGEGLR